MKYFAVVLLALGLMLTSCSKKNNAPAMKTLTDSVSYAIGLDFGKNMKAQEIDLNADLVAQAIKDAKDSSVHVLTEEQIRSAMMNIEKQVVAKQEEKNKVLGAQNKVEGDKFFAENKAKPGVTTLPSGLQYTVLKMGSGPKPKVNEVAILHFIATYIDGSEFANLYKNGQPATWPVGQMFKGASEALQLMPVGSTWKVFIPADLAFGEHGDGKQIAPNKTLIFQIELIDTKPMPAGAAGQNPHAGRPMPKGR